MICNIMTSSLIENLKNKYFKKKKSEKCKKVKY